MPGQAGTTTGLLLPARHSQKVPKSGLFWASGVECAGSGLAECRGTFRHVPYPPPPGVGSDLRALESLPRHAPLGVVIGTALKIQPAGKLLKTFDIPFVFSRVSGKSGENVWRRLLMFDIEAKWDLSFRIEDFSDTRGPLSVAKVVLFANFVRVTTVLLTSEQRRPGTLMVCVPRSNSCENAQWDTIAGNLWGIKLNN